MVTTMTVGLTCFGHCCAIIFTLAENDALNNSEYVNNRPSVLDDFDTELLLFRTVNWNFGVLLINSFVKIRYFISKS
jgi:hypothetical protein